MGQTMNWMAGAALVAGAYGWLRLRRARRKRRAHGILLKLVNIGKLR